jgi:signal transduction histidine kinase
MSRPDSALHYLNLCLASASKNNIKYNQAYAYEGLAQVYNSEKQYQKAYKFALLAQQTANSLASTIVKADAALQLSSALAGLKRFEESLAQHRLYIALKDSLKNDESLQKFTSYSLAIDFEESQKKTAQKEALLNQKIANQRTTNIIYTIVIAIISVMLVFYYNAKRKQIKANALLAEKNKEVLLQTDELHELNILKDRLIGILAHDLRAPLSTLRGMFYLLTEKDITYAEFVEMVPGVFGKLEHTSDFLDTLLFWINSQVDNVAEKSTSFCLCDVVKSELELLDDQFKKKNIAPFNTVGKEHIVLADPNSIRIVVHNFLTNAIKFSHPNSTIKIAAEKKNDMVYFCITDHGVGMSATQLNKLFVKKVDSQQGTMNESGTGMGLVFCKDLIEKYKGLVWAKSTPGKGTELGFSLSAGVSATQPEAGLRK